MFIDINAIGKYNNISCKTSNSLDHVVNDDSLQKVLNGGEIIGIAGVAGNGQKALAELLTGHIKPDSGEILINNMKKFHLDKKNLIFTIDKIIKNER